MAFYVFSTVVFEKKHYKWWHDLLHVYMAKVFLIPAILFYDLIFSSAFFSYDPVEREYNLYSSSPFPPLITRETGVKFMWITLIATLTFMSITVSIIIVKLCMKKRFEHHELSNFGVTVVFACCRFVFLYYQILTLNLTSLNQRSDLYVLGRSFPVWNDVICLSPAFFNVIISKPIRRLALPFLYWRRHKVHDENEVGRAKEDLEKGEQGHEEEGVMKNEEDEHDEDKGNSGQNEDQDYKNNQNFDRRNSKNQDLNQNYQESEEDKKEKQEQDDQNGQKQEEKEQDEEENKKETSEISDSTEDTKIYRTYNHRNSVQINFDHKLDQHHGEDAETQNTGGNKEVNLNSHDVDIKIDRIDETGEHTIRNQASNNEIIEEEHLETSRTRNLEEHVERSLGKMSEEHLITVSENIQLAPLRNLDEFILDRSRFQAPTFNNFKKWNNRIVTNFLYYQTNYFVFLLATIALGSFVHAGDVLQALIGLGLGMFCAFFAASRAPNALNFRQEHPYITLGAILVVGFYNIYVLSAIVVLLFIILIPLLFVFIHASFRLRNFGSKWNYAVEKMHFRRTLMSYILDTLHLDIKAE
ncbi:unnamed protein product [Bursaphelenchus okinawaensis]|uniref:PRA1 family protein n=1 Tax=Bursaphelenchus okinawaensis TaxID=465554 RepID=A0A811KXT1_9BILA|nr:unnamed protein product [Bursaphelenchus okinawaensis]CAG9115154.1 unnamed protein product [Bursaphelenchus okinawaensis]